MQKRIALALALALPTFMIGIDLLVIGVAVAPMAKTFQVPISTVQWFITAYAMGYAAFIGASGRVSEIVGKKTFLICGLALFAVTSLVICLSDSAGVVIAARILQGVSAGVMATTLLSLVMTIFTDKHDQTVWVGALVGMAGLGMALAPPVGGLLITYFGWRSVFIINIPIAIISIAAAMYAIQPIPRDTSQKLDLKGLVLLAVSIFSLVLLISEGYVWGYDSHLFISFAIIFVIAAVLFFIFTLRSKHPLIDLKLFKIKNFSSATFAGSAFYFILLGQILVWGIYLEKAFGLNSLQVGMRLLPIGLLMAIGSFTLRGAIKKFTAKTLIIVGAIIVAASSIWLAFTPINLQYWQLAVGLAAFGFGFFLVNSITTNAALEFVDSRSISMGSSICMLLRWLGSSCGSALTSVIFVLYAQHNLIGHHFSKLIHTAIARHDSAAFLNRLPLQVRASVKHSFIQALHHGMVAVQWMFVITALVVALVTIVFLKSNKAKEQAIEVAEV